MLGKRRITPAGAGKTTEKRVSKLQNGDHPRRCGENFLPVVICTTPLGSPPQVRGKRSCIFYNALDSRITPAGAGKTILRHFRRFGSRDHPRRCGENTDAHKKVALCPGSPPQVRGKQILCREGGLCIRITPAGAGKTTQATTSSPNAPDHPRRCGENSSPRLNVFFLAGSPPQVRGKLVQFVNAAVHARITPAGAGKTSDSNAVYGASKDHPRRCGENGCTGQTTSRLRGSPPQVRGKPCMTHPALSRRRITPAGAGKTKTVHDLGAAGVDHPRRCGENGYRVRNAFTR